MTHDKLIGISTERLEELVAAHESGNETADTLAFYELSVHIFALAAEVIASRERAALHLDT